MFGVHRLDEALSEANRQRLRTRLGSFQPDKDHRDHCCQSGKTPVERVGHSILRIKGRIAGKGRRHVEQRSATGRGRR